jgi:hypothetical protein
MILPLSRTGINSRLSVDDEHESSSRWRGDGAATAWNVVERYPTVSLRTAAILTRRWLRRPPAPAAILPARALFTFVVIGAAFDIGIFSFTPSWFLLNGCFH